ncbi:MAG: TonB-dependent receptor domain-containing protein [Acidobacteriota bacterium]
MKTYKDGTAAMLVLMALCLAAIFTAPAWAQGGSNTGLQGTVTDTTGATIPGVTVVVTRLETGEQRTVFTNDSGNWEARFLSPGPYEVTFEIPGFKKLSRSGITVNSLEMATVDVVLELGEITQVVEVVAGAEIVSSTSSTVTKELSSRELEALPTSSRNFTQLLVIEPGVSGNISELLSNDNASISPSVNGARPTNNSLSFNGLPVTNLLCCNSRINGSEGTVENGGGSLSRNIAPAPETLEEVKVQTALYDAESGRKGGGNFQLISRSGTNEFHGTLYHYLQNDKLIANDFFFNRANVERPVLRRNEGGGTIGGPIIRNRTFFFASYQYTRAITSFIDDASNTVRLPRALTEDRSDAGIQQFAQSIGVQDPSHINSISRSLLQATLPDGSLLIPAGSNGFNCETEEGQESCQVLSIIPATYRQDQFSFNIDHRINDDNTFSGRFFVADQPSVNPLSNRSVLTLFEEVRNTNQKVISLSDIHTVSPSVINEFRAGFFRNVNDRSANANFTNEEFGIINPLAGRRPDLAHIIIQSRDVGETFGFGTPIAFNTDIQNSFTYADTLSFTTGSHSIKVGGDYSRNQLNGTLNEVANGQYAFRTWLDFLTVGTPDERGRAQQINTIRLNYGETIRGYRFTDYSLFIADDWKLTPSLTLNLGLRYELLGHPWEVNGLLNNFDFDAVVESGNLMDGFVFASNFKPSNLRGAEGVPVRLADTKSTLEEDRNNFAPRLGFAWSPKDRFVLRGGYGIFYERTSGAFANSLRQSSPWNREAEIQSRVGDWNAFPDDPVSFPVPQFIVGFDDGEPMLSTADNPTEGFESFETQVIPTHMATPYIQQWSLNTQWELLPNLLLEIGYVGTKGTKLLQIANINQALDVEAVGFLPRPGVPGGGYATNYFEIVDDQFVPRATPPCDVFDDPGDCVIESETRLPILGFDEDEGVNMAMTSANSVYHGLQMSLERRFSRNYMFNVNYTFSKSIDNFSDEGKFQVEHDQSRPWLNRGLSDFDRPHRLTFAWVWDLPLGTSRWAHGWTISGIGTFQSGTPFSIVDDDFSGFLFDSRGPRPNLAPGATHEDLVTSGPVTSRLDNYLNPDAVESSGAQFGNLGRNVVRGPNQRRIDLMVGKVTSITENTSLEFRAEFFNAFNMTSFRNPEEDLSDGDFGEIDETRGGPRVIQFGLKLRF